MKSTLLALTLLSSISFAAPKDRTPHLIRLLGEESYMPVEMTALAHPDFVYVDLDLAKAEGYDVNGRGVTPKGLAQLKHDLAYAVPSKNEGPESYGTKKAIGQATGNGGIGQNGNLGDGRSATVVEGYRSKGVGRTGRVGPQAESDHKSGGLILSDAIRETIWSNLLAKELPFGAYRALAIITTGTQTTPNFVDWQARSLLIAEDPHRFGHTVSNETAENLGGAYAADNKARVEANIRMFPESLPLPPGTSEASLSRPERFKRGLSEAIDRQAIQHAYLWAHRMFHGATSPSNASFDGRLLDFGTMIALEGYARVQILSDDGPSGGTEVLKRDLLKNSRDSWVKTLPPELLAVLPSEQEMEARFESKFRETQRLELVRNAGAVDDLMPLLKTRLETKKLGDVLFQVAIHGNDKVLNLWDDRLSPKRIDGYNLETILNKLAALPIENLAALDRAIASDLPDARLRADLVTAYQATFKIQQAMAFRRGIGSNAESKYRALATEIRNRPMRTLMYSPEWDAEMSQLISNFETAKDGTAIQKFIDKKLSENRREFRDAAPFTLVLKERHDSKTGEKIREVFDARVNKAQVTRTDIVEHSAVSIDHVSRRPVPLTCFALFK